MRVLVFELVTSEAELSARLLPRLAAAVLSWPTALTPDPPPFAGLLGHALLAALHDLSFTALHDQVHYLFLQHVLLTFPCLTLHMSLTWYHTAMSIATAS